MELLDLLVTSSTRRTLLRLLWGESVEASAHQLAELSEASYAQVHGELEYLAESGLVLKKQDGRANLYRKNSKCPFSAQLQKLTQNSKPSLSPEKLSEHEVLAHLGQLGVPLGEFSKPQKKCSHESLLVAGTGLARCNASLARVLPVAYFLLKDDLNYKKLRFLAQEQNLTQEVGFFLDLSGAVSNSTKLRKAAKEYRDKRYKKTRSFFLKKSKSTLSKQLEEQNTPHLAKKWMFTINIGLDSFSELFQKTVKARS